MTDSAGLNHGIVLPNWVVGGDPGLLVEYGELAEEAGWDGVFRADHSIPPTEKETESFPRSMAYAYRSRCPDGLDQTGLVDYADSTSPTVASGPKPRNTRSPLDGRVILGTGLGGESLYTTVGQSWEPKRLAQQYDEALDVITGLWQGESLGYEGTTSPSMKP